MNHTLQALREHKDALLNQLAAIPEFRPGSRCTCSKCGGATRSGDDVPRFFSLNLCRAVILVSRLESAVAVESR